MRKSIFFIEAPFQVLSAYEAIFEFSLRENYLLIVRLSGHKQNDLQLRKVVNYLFIDNRHIQFIFIRSKRRTMIDYLKIFYNIVKICTLQFRYKYIFIGNMESGFLSKMMLCLKNNKIFLLDDGIKLFTLQKKFTKKYYFNLFTMLLNLKPIPNQVIVYNTFVKIQEQISTIKIKSGVLFLGSKLSEVGIMSEESYINYIIKISKYYNNREIIYVSHRGEDDNKLLQLSKILNLNILKLDYPIELYPIFTNEITQDIASFYSAALVSISILYPNTIVKSFLIKEPLIYKSEIKALYEYLEQNLEVVNLND
jgi:hypothetical protein